MSRLDSLKQGQTALGVEFGSTRIKSVLIDANNFEVLASGSFEWENQLVNGTWTYSLEDVWKGLQASYADLKAEVKSKYAFKLSNIGKIGISAMMHGYLVFDQTGKQLAEFRTWRNAITEQAAGELSKLFNFNIPQRWCIAHLYQAILNQEKSVSQIDFMTTLAGYVHWQLTGKKVTGIGDASGIFPIDSNGKNYDQKKLDQFSDLKGVKKQPWDINHILPKVLLAGQEAGQLTKQGSLLIDPTGDLQAASVFCPPEGDAGTGMVATNSVNQRSGNVSAGTSIFSMVVLEHPLKKVYPEVDVVSTPTGDDVAMIHANNATSDINAWMHLFEEFLVLAGKKLDKETVFRSLFFSALTDADADAGNLLTYGYYSGENITGLKEGRPLLVRSPESKFTIANLMRAQILSVFGALKIGMDILKKEEVKIDRLTGHGGLFKTPRVAQQILADVLETPISVTENAAEGGAWGIAILAAYIDKASELSLAEYLKSKVFSASSTITIEPNYDDLPGTHKFMDRYQKGLDIEQAAIEHTEVD